MIMKAHKIEKILHIVSFYRGNEKAKAPLSLAQSSLPLSLSPSLPLLTYAFSFPPLPSQTLSLFPLNSSLFPSLSWAFSLSLFPIPSSLPPFFPLLFPLLNFSFAFYLMSTMFALIALKVYSRIQPLCFLKLVATLLEIEVTIFFPYSIKFLFASLFFLVYRNIGLF